MTVLLAPVIRWHCPACKGETVTRRIALAPPHHVCPKTRFLAIPYLAAGTKAKVEVREREDYIGTEAVQLDPELGRPVMNVTTVRDDGQDCRVYAPTATGTG